MNFKNYNNMITALQSGSITALINHFEEPMKNATDGKYIMVDGSDKLMKMQNRIERIKLVIPDDEGTSARIVTVNYNDIARIYEAATAIIKELPAPCDIEDYDWG